ncbi:hypothetical protein B0T26DRAFT_681501 [Lasiosphaeria miniovina]|uniref:Uncharacterized protein n=1 Tax=Lasiosphaeria miniovina TaxID=1954250 RepID=A0AA40DL55_9PEZI|nr:uncharacterized protein B0T26DRAFT_681501 [Lasiosphaeria miniovina]KAK0703878.1 hypothetical protein B0T26DRAFT_681501 [Lasiosphaeria miniovina]
MSAQDPSGPPQPPKAAAYALASNPVSHTADDFAVADTPGTSGFGGSGSDYMSYRSHKNPPPAPPTAGHEHGVHSEQPANAREARETSYASDPRGERQNDNEDAEQMAPAGEGAVAHVVERRTRGSAAAASHTRGEGAPHGRVRGEVTLDGGEAGVERKKAQQSLAREQVKAARREGKDVDGRGEGNFAGRQPHAEID